MKMPYPEFHSIFIQQILVRIRHSRNLQKISQHSMAAHLGISQNAYSKLELGNSELTLRKLLIICNALQEPLKNFLRDV